MPGIKIPCLLSCFGRLSVARSPQDVLDAAYAEAMAAINNLSAIEITTDPAGRIQVTLEGALEGDDDIVKTIDAPLENLALYQAIMKDGYLAGLTTKAEALLTGNLANLVDDGPTSHADMDIAAALLAGAADKFGSISLDVVINLNTLLGINTPSGYFDFSGYIYSRETSYSTTDATLLLPEPDAVTPISSLVYRKVSIFGAEPPVFMDPQAETMDARGFTQAADDALRTIFYIHNWEAPELPAGYDWVVVE